MTRALRRRRDGSGAFGDTGLLGDPFRKLRSSVKSLLTPAAERRHALVGPKHHWKMKRAFQIQFLKSVGLRPEHHLLDIGCGTLRGGVPLIEYLDTGHYCGLEAREEVLREGKKELHEANLEHKRPVLLAPTSLATLNLRKQFDFIWAFSVLIHMSDEVLEDSLSLVARHLSPAGVFHANVNVGDRPEGEWQGFPVVSRSLEFYQQAAARHGLRVAALGTLKSLGHETGATSQDAQIMLRFSRV